LPDFSRQRRSVALTCLVAVILIRLAISAKFLPSVSALNITGLSLHLAAFWPALALIWLLIDQSARRPNN
jgi:hypothetical protein